MEQEERTNEERKNNSVFSKKIRAGKRRTYFFDVRTTRANDYYLTITESKKKFNEDGYERHKVFIYKEDFNKFIEALSESVDHIKKELMPDYDFDQFSRKENEEHDSSGSNSNQDTSDNKPASNDDLSW